MPIPAAYPVPEAVAGCAREADELSAFGLFAALPERSRAQLARELTRRRYRAGEHLWHAGDPAWHLILIEGGVIEIERIRRSGDGVVLGLFGTGQSVGLPAVLAGKPYPADALVLSERADVIRIRAGVLLSLMHEYPGLSLAVNRALLQHNAALRAALEIIGAGAVPKRLAALFLFLGRRFGASDAGGTLRIGLPLSREQIGRMVGARVETVIRILSRWQKAGWLKSAGARGGIEIARVDMLERISDAG